MIESDKMVEDFLRKDLLETQRRREDERIRLLRAWNDSGADLPTFFDSVWARCERRG